MKEYNEQDTPDIMEIDKNNLDEEWVKQPRRYYEYSVYLADAIDEVSNCKAGLDLKRADISNAVRSAPEDYELVKITETAINEIVISDTEYQEIQTELQKAERTVNVLKGATRALEHKREGLNWNTKLFLANYYAEKLPEDVKDRIEEKVDREDTHNQYQSRRRTKDGN